jgi:DNA-binding MarR family transcriptional regulator
MIEELGPVSAQSASAHADEPRATEPGAGELDAGAAQPAQQQTAENHSAELQIAGLSESIARLRRAMRRAARTAEPAKTLTVAQLELLSCLAEHPGSRPGELAKMLRLAPNTVTTLINALTPRDLVSRTTADNDRRAVAMRLTDAGERAVRDWQETNAAILSSAVGELSPAQQRVLGRAVPALEALARAIDDLPGAPV